MVIAEPGWLQTLGQIAGVLLLIELGLVLVIVCALMVGLAVGAHWVHIHVMPVAREYLPRAEQAMSATQKGAEKAVRGIAVFYGWRQRVETTARVMLFGRAAAKRVFERSAIQASSDLQMIGRGGTELPGAPNEFTPAWREPAATETPRPAERMLGMDGHDGGDHGEPLNTLADNAG
ncbi:MAG: hypothetical protein ACHQ4H_04545 [Ktedonobacterales bacterium]